MKKGISVLAAVAAMVMSLALAGCGGQSKPDSTVNTNGSDSQQTKQEPKTNSRGNLVKRIGDKASVSGDDGKELANWTVTGINLSPQCTESYQAPVKNGHLVALDVQVNTTSKLHGSMYDPFHIGSGSLWKYIGKDGSLWNGDLLNESTVSCMPSTEMLPSDIGPGAKAQGKVILDLPQTDGSLVFSPVEGDGWEYPLQ